MTETPEVPEEGAVEAPARRRWPWVLLGFLGVLVVGGGVGGWLFIKYLPDIAGNRAIASAQEKGFDLGYDSIDVEAIAPWDQRPAQVILRGVRAKNLVVPDVDIEVKEIRATLKKLDVVSVEAIEPHVTAPSLQALFAFEEALKSGPSKDLPLTSTNAQVRVSQVADDLMLSVVANAKTLTMKDGQVVAEGMTIKPEVPLISLGIPPVPVTLERSEDRVWLRPDDFKAAKIGVDRKGERGYLELEGVTNDAIPKWLGVQLPGKSVTGKLDVGLTGADALKGSFNSTVAGYVPPHPRELQGILFGDATKVSGKFALDGFAVKITELSVKAGTLELKGTGELALLDGHVTLDLKGAVPCAELAVSAIGAHVGGVGSIIAGRLARGRLTGTVETRVTVDANVRDLEKAKVAPSAFVHCSVAI
ncbi:MAG: hypothetical protein HOV80_06350 [Polyangiaceae bacterium]|nr:hypothetical protein [Polyangiaceae bacterium]